MRKEHAKLPKLIVMLGPTACGKTVWSIRIAKKIGGMIISADSRQIYKGMDIGTAKEKGDWRWTGLSRAYYIDEVPHHIIDFLNPGKRFSVAEFRDRAIKNVRFAHRSGRVPMIVGGTGLYISSIVDNFSIPRIPPNRKLRASLEEKTHEELHKLLMQLDPKAAKDMDIRNKRRMIRALEVCIFSGEPFSEQRQKGEQLFDILQIGIDVPRDVLYDRINARVDQMMEEGLLDEVEALVKQRYGWTLPSMNGIGYHQFRPYFEGECTLEEAVELLKRDTRHYARRQLSWFRRDKRIKWCTTYEEAEALVDDFLAS